MLGISREDMRRDLLKSLMETKSRMPDGSIEQWKKLIEAKVAMLVLADPVLGLMAGYGMETLLDDLKRVEAAGNN